MTETFILKWAKTWADRRDDFTGRDPHDARSFARVYRQKGTPDPDKAWYWTVSIDERRIASGHTADGPEGARPAVRAAETAWRDYRDSRSGADRPTDRSGPRG
jgi:hypothetical protein